MKNNSAIRLLTICLCVISLSGCAHRMNPRPRMLQDNAIPSLKAEGVVAVKSECKDNRDIKICSAGWTAFKGSLCEFTDVATAVMANALQRANVNVVDAGNADKTLQLSLEKAYCKWTGASIVIIKVKTGDGLERTFEGRKMAVISAYEYTRDFEIAMAQAVENAITNDQIQAYLRK